MLSGRQPFFYRRLPSPLHATRASVGALWAFALTCASLLLFQPLLLLVLMAATLTAGYAAGVGRPLARMLRTAVVVAIPIVAINVLVSREGLTVFARVGDLGPFGQGDLTLEAAIYGAVIALKVTLLILVTTLASLAIDPDELLRGFRGRLSFRSALTATLATRMLPLLAADAGRLAEAQRTRAERTHGGARGRIALISAVVGGSLDRAMDVAATLELRGFAVTRHGAPHGVESSSGRRARRPCSRHDIAFACSAVAILALSVLDRVGEIAPFSAYPRVHAPIGAGAILLSVALVTAVLLPFCDRRGVQA